MEDGISPVKEFDERMSRLKRVNLDKDSGMLPVK